jgi:putative hydrolase of the HAD superfamily
LSLRAVVFDYGMVLTGPRDPAILAEMVRLTGLPFERFEKLYWVDRHAFDEGRLTGLEYWRKIVRDGGLALPDDVIRRLDRLDGQLWSTVNERMVAWQARLKERGLLTAILSNMGDSTLAVLLGTHGWIANFDVHVWSYQLRIGKPDPAIYLHTLERLAVPAQWALFIDDKAENIAAAQALGMKAIQFSTAEQLRADLIAAGFDAELPLP